MFEQEKRQHVRIQFSRQVQVDNSSEVYDKCQVTNISLGGMYVTGKFPHTVDDQCYVNFTQTSKATSLTLKALAEIVRHDEDGIALEFVSMPFASMVLLELILLYESGERSSGTEMKLPQDLPFKICDEEFTIPDK